MKKFLVALLAAAVFGGAFAQSAFPDVPENHWADDAVDRIADLGIVIGFPDGTFRGNDAFTRYQSALVVSRLLDVIGDELNARQVLTDADLASLRNAVQELASDVAGLDQRHSGEIAAIADDVAGNSARLDAIEDLLGTGDSEALRDLQNQVASQRVAVDTAQAQAEAAEALAQDALDAARMAANRASQNAEAIDALTWLSQDLNDRVTALETAPAGTNGDLAGRVARTEADIANIREFVILLRSDQIAMRDQVAALEETAAQHGADISELQDRVASLERDRITLSGSIALNYRVDRMSGAGDPFDVDRAFGLGSRRQMSTSVFSSGPRTNGPAAERPAQFWADIHDGTFSRPVTASLTLNIGFGNNFDATGAPNALNNFDSVITLELKRAFNVDSNASGSTQFADAYVFSVKDFSSEFTLVGIGGAPITFDYGREVSVRFTPYVFQLDDAPGFVATVSNPVGFLDFLDPTLTVAYSGDAVDTFFSGARLTMSPLAGVTIGGSFARFATLAGENADALADNSETTVWGVDASAAISIFSLEAEYASSSYSDATEAVTRDAESILYVEVGVDTANIPVLNSLSANYRDIAADWLEGGVTAETEGLGILADDDDYPFAEDQTGFGVNASLSLFIVDLEAYFDSYSITDPAAADVTAFGVDVSADLFRGFGVTGFFSQISVDGVTVDTAARPVAEDNLAVSAADVERDVNYVTGFGIGLVHDGAADNALVSGLNISAEYKQLEADFGRRVIDVKADYELDIAFLTLTPYAEYLSEVSAAGISTHTDNRNTIRAGTGLSTEEFGFFLKPSLEAAVNYRSTAHDDINGNIQGDYDATELQFSVGVKLNEFLFDNSTLTVRYGSWTGENVRATLVNGGAVRQGIPAASQFNADANGVTQSVNGWEAVWNYWDLQFAYGVYTSDNGTAPTTGQAYSIKYTVNF
jgi:hypothetical protein